MRSVPQLITDVAAARERFLVAVGSLTAAQASFRPAPEMWTIVDNIEHMVLAEQVGINGIWKALDGHRAGRPVWMGDAVNRGLPIEEVIARTWAEREQVPAVAAPRLGGPAAYWIAALHSCQPVLEALGVALEGAPLEEIMYPHPISGPLDARQRLEFLRFHLDRHRAQVMRVREHPDFPRDDDAT